MDKQFEILRNTRNYTPWTNRYGVEITTIADVLGFLPYPEGLHLGYIMVLKRIITNSHQPIG